LARDVPRDAADPRRLGAPGLRLQDSRADRGDDLADGPAGGGGSLRPPSSPTAKRLVKVHGDEDGPEQWATLGCLFAFESALTLDTICAKYRELLQGTAFGLHIDLILVLDRGLVTLVACGPGSSAWSKMMAPTGTGGAAGEGFHIGIAGTDLGDRSLDAFLRILVAHLSLFRHAVGHPGFDWAAMGAAGTTRLHYLTSFTGEREPAARAAKLREYAKDFKKRFPMK
jgi:hypothetical protein